MKVIKAICIVFGTILLLVLCVLTYIKLKYSQGVIDEYRINGFSTRKSVLISSQKSEFKNRLLKIIIDTFNGDDINVKILDSTMVDQEDSINYDLIVIINSIEAGRLHKNVNKFIRNLDNKDKLLLIATIGSGNRDYRPVGIDSVTTASNVSRIDDVSNKIISHIKK